MADCEYLGECSSTLFRELLSENAKSFWIRTCCTTEKQEHCARRILKQEGKEAPETLLPNGKYLDILDTIVL